MEVKDAVKQAWEGADSVDGACDNLKAMMEANRTLYNSVMQPHIDTAVRDLIGSDKRQERRQIWSKQVAKWSRPVAPDERAKVLARINTMTIMDMRLRSGKRLGDAMKNEVADERDYYSKMSDHMADKARFFGVIAEKMKKDQTVSQAFKPQDLEAVRVAA